MKAEPIENLIASYQPTSGMNEMFKEVVWHWRSRSSFCFILAFLI